jgi:hypothetical protein
LNDCCLHRDLIRWTQLEMTRLTRLTISFVPISCMPVRQVTLAVDSRQQRREQKNIIQKTEDNSVNKEDTVAEASTPTIQLYR